MLSGVRKGRLYFVPSRWWWRTYLFFSWESSERAGRVQYLLRIWQALKRNTDEGKRVGTQK